MKRIITVLFCALLALSIAACGVGGNGGKIGEEKDDGKYDKTFSLLVGDTEEWTPFDEG